MIPSHPRAAALCVRPALWKLSKWQCGSTSRSTAHHNSPANVDANWRLRENDDMCFECFVIYVFKSIWAQKLHSTDSCLVIYCYLQFMIFAFWKWNFFRAVKNVQNVLVHKTLAVALFGSWNTFSWMFKRPNWILFVCYCEKWTRFSFLLNSTADLLTVA